MQGKANAKLLPKIERDLRLRLREKRKISSQKNCPDTGTNKKTTAAQSMPSLSRLFTLFINLHGGGITEKLTPNFFPKKYFIRSWS